MIAIFGAGISGLQAAGQLQQAGVEFCVLEAGPAVGGLARTGELSSGDSITGLGAL